jgi:carbonic anhydrase
MDRLLNGYRQFRDGYYRQHEQVFRDLALRGQKPRCMMIGCADARVDPAITFGTSPGDVFMVRNVANLVPPYAPDQDFHGTSAALEFGIKGLEVANIVVLGHARCGGVATLMGAGTLANTDFIEPWMQIAKPARERALELARAHGHASDSPEACRICEMEGVKVSLQNLMTFPWVAERVLAGRTGVHGLYFDITSGELHKLDGRDFVKVV